MNRALVPFGMRVCIMVRSNVRSLAVILAAVTLYLVRARIGDGHIDLVEACGTAAGLIAVGTPLVLAGVCRDLEHGVGQLWLQKPVSPARFFLARFCETAVVAVGLPMLTACLGAAAAIGNPNHSAAEFLMGALSVGLWASMIISVGFGMSAWLPRHGRLATVALLILTFAVYVQTALALDVATYEPGSGLWLQRALPPIADLIYLRDYFRGASSLPVGSLVWVFVYSAIWIALGALGVHRSAHRRIARSSSA